MTHQSGNADFENTWDTLLAGFNDAQTGEYFIGNYVLWHLIKNGNYTLRFDMWLADGTFNSAEYSGISMTPEAERFGLALGNYDSGSATAGGLVTYHGGANFSTYDNDYLNGCASRYLSGWWYLQSSPVLARQSNGTVSEETSCFTSLLTSAANMTWALENEDGVITGHVSVDKVVMRMMVDPDTATREYMSLNQDYVTDSCQVFSWFHASLLQFSLLCLANVAFERIARMSSEAEIGTLANSVDDDTDTCVATMLEANPWWMVDLGAEYTVSGITLTTTNNLAGAMSTSSC